MSLTGPNGLFAAVHEDGINDFTCRCNPGYAGRLCDRKIDECKVNPCENGGTCEELGYGEYKVIKI